MLIPLDIPPGVYRNGTDYSSRGRFNDADLWRWFENTQRPIGGWRLKSAQTVTGKARAILTWLDNSSQAWTAIGTEQGLYVYTRSGVRHTITPAGFVAGNANATTGGGYGTGTYGTGVYGVPRPDSTNTIPADVWTLDTWGEYLVACFKGKIYEWTLNVANPAVLISGAPDAEAIISTEERSLFALGADGDPRSVKWSDLEDNTDWTPSATNQAGGKRLQTDGRLLCGKRIRGGLLLFTDTDVHLATYDGLPYVYRIERQATGCGLISKQGVAVTGAGTYWMGANGFWVYNSGVQPLQCDVGDYIFSDINQSQRSKVAAVHNSQYGEVWWCYPSAASIEIDRYVSFNYRENHWSIGSLVRLCGTDRGVLPYPLMVGSDGSLYEHEVGTLRDNRSPYALSGPVEMGNGETTMDVETVIPDELALGDVVVSFTTGDWPLSPDEIFGPYAASEKTDVRFNARRVAIKLVATPDQDFRVGTFRVEARPGSPR